MKCPKCGVELDENARTCSACNFSITVDGNPVQLPIIDDPIIPGTFISPKPEVAVSEENTMSMEEQKSVPEVKEETPSESAPVLADETPAPIVSPAEETEVDDQAVELPKVEVSPAPEVTPEVPETPVAAPVIDTPAVEAPVPTVEAPVVDSPAAPALEVATPAPTTPEVAPAAPEVAPAPVVTPDAATQAAPTVAQVTENQTAQVVTQMPANALEVTSTPSQVVVSAPAKKSPVLYIVIGLLGVVVVVLAFFLVKSLDNSNKLEPKVKNHELNQEIINNEETPTEETPEPQALSDEISLYGIKFKLPDGFEYIYENQYYQVFNTELRKLFILDDLYTGDSTELEQGINLMKTEYPSSGCKDVTTSMGNANGIKYGFVSYVVDNQKLEEIYTLVNDKYILAFYNIQTNIVTTQDFIDYTTSIAKTADDSAANFSASDSISKHDWKFDKSITTIETQDN